MKYYDVKDLMDLMAGKYKNNEIILDSKETLQQLNRQEDNIEYYKKSYVAYQNILNIYADLVKEIGLQNSLQIAMLFTYLLWNGYFSEKGTHMFTDNRIASIEGLASFDVMNGRGVCISYSTMLRDLLIVCGYDSANLLNVQDDNLKLSYMPQIYRRQGRLKRVTKFDEFMSKLATDKIGNHVFTLINQDGNLYAYDPTNLTLISIKNLNEARVVNGKGKFKLKSYTSYIMNLPEESSKLLEKMYKTETFNNPYTAKYFKDTFTQLIKYLNKNSQILYEYYNRAYDDISYVAHTAREEAKKR